MPTTKRDIGVDFLRAACILYIVGYWHLIPYTEALPGYANLYTTALKYITLATFVFCSGFLLARQSVPLDAAGLRGFYARRLLRIYPLYLSAIALFWAADLAPTGQLVDGILLTSMFDPPTLPTMWFITMIMLFYLIAPFVIRIADSPLPTTLSTAAVIGALVAVHLWVKQIDPRLLLYWPIFVFAILYRRNDALRDWLTRHALWLVALLPVVLWLAQGSNEWSLSGVARGFPIALVGTLVLFIYAPTLARPLHAPTVLFLAYAGFGLYLLHRVTFKLAIAAYFPDAPWNQVWYLLLIVMPATILIAYAIQTAYDRGIERLFQRSRIHTPSPGTVEKQG
ncbi:MAG: acyltransferase [Thiohalocapsa sp.]|nr:acyltransferase [Thiohalocapsa sp.]MCF7992358.1 acyltransferase [Thiohalocapsa sp.]